MDGNPKNIEEIRELEVKKKQCNQNEECLWWAY